MAIRKTLEDRLERLETGATGITTPVSGSRSVSPVTAADIPGEIASLSQLLAIAKSKAEVRINQVMDIVRTHIGTGFFEWDASHLGGGVYWTAILLTRSGGSEEDVTLCLQALNECRWAFSKGMDRSAE